ncbi:MAG TPA: hypothetical protein VLC09_13425 [Polyangiaceae bacterium]|nr:hypothetical protein [Polyangiaceae bacterium]
MALSFLTPAEFKLRATLPREFIVACEQVEPGWLQKQLEMKTAWIVARLEKRYGPWSPPYPEIAQGWLTSLVTMSVMLRRGFDPEDKQAADFKEEAAAAKSEIAEAANAETGLFELPLRADTTEGGVSRGGPFGYSEQSPYVAFDQQAAVGRNEDFNGGGTYG